MPKKTTGFDLERNYRAANFNQIVGIAEKLMTSLVKRVQQVENTLK
jgi:hypothetical protein